MKIRTFVWVTLLYVKNHRPCECTSTAEILDLLDYPDLRVVAIVLEDGVYWVNAVAESEPAGCSHCGRLAIFLQKHGTKSRTVADSPVRGNRVVINLKQQRYICLLCHKTTVQPFPGVDGKKRLTRRLERYIGKRATTEPFTVVAKETGLSEKAVRGAFERFSRGVLESRNPHIPKSLGIDDVYIGRKACCVLMDNDAKRPYDLLPSRKKATLYRRLLLIPNRNHVGVVTIDMCAAFRDAARAALPNAIIVVDRFHIQRFANRAAQTVARDARPTKKSGKGFTRDRFLLLRDPDQMRDEEKVKRDHWLREEPLVNQAYQLKKSFLDLWGIRDRSQAEAAYENWLKQIPDELKDAFRKLTTAMGNWHIEIFNYWDHCYTNANCESHNRIIKDIQRRGRSYDFETVRTKVLCRDVLRQEELARHRKGRDRHYVAPISKRLEVPTVSPTHSRALRGDYEPALSTRKSVIPKDGKK